MNCEIAKATASSFPRLNILVVDDDEVMRGLLKLHLSAAGYVVTVASDAISAGHQILNMPPDLLILDINLPYMNGLDFAATLLADSTVPDLPIIFITSDEHIGPKTDLLGADFIVKPFQKQRLLESVAKVLAKAK